MFELLDRSLNLYTVIWLFPIAFMFHDLEEIVMVERFLLNNKDKLRSVLSHRLYRKMEKIFCVTSAQFAVAVAVVFSVLSAATIMVGQSLHSTGALLFYTACVLILFLNVFTHIGQSILFKGYTPGIITALLIAFPYSTYCLYRLMQEGLIDWQMIGISLPLGIMLIIPVMHAGHRLGRWIAGEQNVC